LTLVKVDNDTDTDRDVQPIFDLTSTPDIKKNIGLDDSFKKKKLKNGRNPSQNSFKKDYSEDRPTSR
jgi:hypothetical protein